MVNIHPFPHKRLPFESEPDNANYLSAVGGPNSSYQVKSRRGKLQVGFSVSLSEPAVHFLFVSVELVHGKMPGRGGFGPLGGQEGGGSIDRIFFLRMPLNRM